MSLYFLIDPRIQVIIYTMPDLFFFNTAIGLHAVEAYFSYVYLHISDYFIYTTKTTI